MLLINIVLCLAGFYLIYMCVTMKATGKIPKQMVNNKINLERAKDIPGYIKHMSPRGIICGLFLSVFSIFCVINEFVPLDALMFLLIQLGYVVTVIVLAVIMVKAQNRFLI